MKGSVKIMRSYDYNHFEVCLSSDEEMTLKQVDDMRKEAARLADKAVKQYQEHMKHLLRTTYDTTELRKQVAIIKENYPKSEWSEEQKAKVKKLETWDFHRSRDYDYQDDWEEWEDDENC